MPKLTYHGHSTFTVECDDGTNLVIDPFFRDNPLCDHDGSAVEADFVLLTHGHGDHVGDALALAERTKPVVVATYEIASYFETKGHDTSPQHIGGAVTYPFGRVKMTPAIHGGKLELPGAEGYTTTPAGLLIDFDGGPSFYHAGDTALTLDMQLLKGKVDYAALPIGDRYTMGPEDAVTAIDFIEPRVVIPIHFDTWPVIEQDTGAWAAAVGERAQVEVMTPGAMLEL